MSDILSIFEIPEKTNTIELQYFKQHTMPELSRFVTEVYFNNPRFNFDCSEEFLYQEILFEDVFYKNFSTTIVAKDNSDQIEMTFKLICKEKDVLLPIEREFNVDLQELLNRFDIPGGTIMELSRFASKKNHGSLFIRMLRSTAKMYKDEKNILVVACADEKVRWNFKRMGIQIQDVAAPKTYLGSVTYPIAVKADTLWNNRWFQE